MIASRMLTSQYVKKCTKCRQNRNDSIIPIQNFDLSLTLLKSNFLLARSIAVEPSIMNGTDANDFYRLFVRYAITLPFRLISRYGSKRSKVPFPSVVDIK